MKFGDDEAEAEIGGRELGPVQIDLQGDQGRGQQLIGQARVLLGNLKQRMQFNHIMQGSDRRVLPKETVITTLVNGTLKVIITDTIYRTIAVSSIKGYGAFTDQDKIVIAVQVERKIEKEQEEEAGGKKIKGFAVHFKRNMAFIRTADSVVDYWVSEPFNTSGNVVISINDPTNWLPLQTILGYGSVSANSEKYSHYTYDYAINGSKPGMSLALINTWLDHNTGLIWTPYTPYGLSMTSKGVFNDLYKNYTLDDGYVASAEVITNKVIKETPVLNEHTVIPGSTRIPEVADSLTTDKGKLLPGWYGISGACMFDMNGWTQSDTLGFTFVITLDDDSHRTFNFDYSVAAGPNITVVSEVTTLSVDLPVYFLLNTETGLLNVYDGSTGDNPFYNVSNAPADSFLGFGPFWEVLQKGFDPNVKPLKTINLLD